MKLTRYIVTAVDHGETCDGKARVLAVLNTKEEATNFVTEDIKEWVDQRAGEGVECDFNKMTAHYDYNSEDGCEWNIHEVGVELTTAELEEAAKEACYL